MEEYSRVYKIIVVGDTETGKSQIVSRFTQNVFVEESKPTVVMEHARKVLKGRKICAQLWDMAGKELFRESSCCYYRYSLGAIVVYDITKVRSFESAAKWLDQLKEILKPDCPITMLLGNKLDLRSKRSVTSEEGRKLAQKHKALFIEASARDATNIDKAFDRLIECITEKFDDNQKRAAKKDIGDLEKGSFTLKKTGKQAKGRFTDAPVIIQQPGEKPKNVHSVGELCVEGTKYCCSKIPLCFT
ncbi:uncharacterized protein LOC143452162 [Clavelina lepadiformis]|uniref:uncharacterized protein LOC143452162 n=1 Tax=Clavelina lepadiformis TaxID=159417 RepID=UPI004041BF8E